MVLSAFQRHDKALANCMLLEVYECMWWSPCKLISVLLPFGVGELDVDTKAANVLEDVVMQRLLLDPPDVITSQPLCTESASALPPCAK